MTADTIDIAALKKLKDMIGGDTEDLMELVDDFVSGFPDQVGQMQDQMAQQDWGALRIAAHSCKSNARDVGATALSGLCAELELQCRNGVPQGPDVQLQQIESAGHAAIAALKQLDLDHV